MRSQGYGSRLAVRMARILLLDEEFRADDLSPSIARTIFVFHTTPESRRKESTLEFLREGLGWDAGGERTRKGGLCHA